MIQEIPVVMHEVTFFLMSHWVLAVLFLVVFLTLIMLESYTHTRGDQEITAQSLVRLMNRDLALVLDIRDGDSFRRGHIINALNIPLTELEQKIAKLMDHKQKSIVVVCYTGRSAMLASKQLLQHGFSSVQVLTGGMKAWQEAGLPLEKES